MQLISCSHAHLFEFSIGGLTFLTSQSLLVSLISLVWLNFLLDLGDLLVENFACASESLALSGNVVRHHLLDGGHVQEVGD